MTIEQWLQRFSETTQAGAPPWTCSVSQGEGPHLVFSALVHGDEVAPLAALTQLAERLRAGQLRFQGRVSLMLGNPEAARLGRRYVEADLNRVFVDQAPDSLEARRAREMREVLDTADLYLDFHQVTGPCPHPFWTLPWSAEAARWIRALRGAPVWVTRAPGQVFATGTCCADEYVRARGKPGLTLEMGTKGMDLAQADAVVAVVERCLTLAAATREDPQALQRAAGSAPPMELLVTAHKEPFTRPELALRADLIYFSELSAGERVSRPGTPELRAPVAGKLLFPKRQKRDAQGRALGTLPTDIFHIVRPLQADPAELWG